MIFDGRQQAYIGWERRASIKNGLFRLVKHFHPFTLWDADLDPENILQGNGKGFRLKV